MKFGYARVSTGDQEAASQIDALKASGVAEENIFVDKISGKLASRPAWNDLLSRLREGDELHVTRLSRMGRSLTNVLEVVKNLSDKGVGINVLKQAIDTSNAYGRFQLAVFAAMDELQREIISENTIEGLESARARGRKGGRRPKTSPSQDDTIRMLYDARKLTVADIAEQFKISPRSVYNALARTVPVAPEIGVSDDRDE
jgi:DNA invertase Pin-like site-specific DNA recombinase